MTLRAFIENTPMIYQIIDNYLVYERAKYGEHRPYRSRHTIGYLNINVPEFIELKNWPPNSPDLNPVDYSIWGALQQLVYREPIENVDHLKHVIIHCRAEISQDLVDAAIDEWPRRVAAVVQAAGGHIEYLLD